MREERVLDNTDTCALREAHVGAMEASDKDVMARPHVGAVEASEDALGPEMELALSTSCGDAPCKRRRPARTQRVRRLERARRALSSSPALEEAGMCEERVLDSTDTCTMREAHASDTYSLRGPHVDVKEASEVDGSSASSSSDAESESGVGIIAVEQQVAVWLGEQVSAVVMIADLELQAGSKAKVFIHTNDRVLAVPTAPPPLPGVVQHLVGADLTPAALEYREFYLKAVWAVDAPLSPLWNVEIDTDTSLILVPGHAEVMAAESRRVALEEAYAYSLEALLCP